MTPGFSDPHSNQHQLHSVNSKLDIQLFTTPAAIMLSGLMWKLFLKTIRPRHKREELLPEKNWFANSVFHPLCLEDDLVGELAFVGLERTL